VTHWGGDTVPRIFDYSWHEWGGLLGPYYGERWARFHRHLAQLLAQNQTWTEQGLPTDYDRPKLQANEFYRDLYNWETNWIQAPKHYAADHAGDSVAVARRLLAKYQPLFAVHFAPAGREHWAALRDKVQNPASAPNEGQRVWSWKSGEVGTAWKEVSFDITTALGDASEFTLEFLFERGAHRLEMKGIVLLQNGTALAEDNHEGRTGNEHVNNLYHFKIPMAVPGARYTVKATVRTSGGSNSTGSVWLKGSQ
jgi:alpha-N-acetylglucosaminidase